MRAFIPKFDRKIQISEPLNVMPKAHLFNVELGQKDHLRLYAGVVENKAAELCKEKEEMVIPRVDKCVYFSSSEEERRWLEGFTGSLRKDFLWESYGGEIQRKCPHSLIYGR